MAPNPGKPDLARLPLLPRRLPHWDAMQIMPRHKTRRLGISGPGSALRRNHDLGHHPSACATELLNPGKGKIPSSWRLWPQRVRAHASLKGCRRFECVICIIMLCHVTCISDLQSVHDRYVLKTEKPLTTPPLALHRTKTMAGNGGFERPISDPQAVAWF
jgi:hypothetical protein